METRLPAGFEWVTKAMGRPTNAARFLRVTEKYAQLSKGALAILNSREHVRFAISRDRRQLIIIPCDGTSPDAFKLPKTGMFANRGLLLAIKAIGGDPGERYPISVEGGYATVKFPPSPPMKAERDS